MLLKFCEHTVYVARLRKKSTSQSLLANYCIRPLLGAWGFASSTDRQRVEAVLRRGVRSGLYPSQQTANGIVDSADDKLFELVLQSGDW